MEAQQVTSKNQTVRDLSPGEVMVIASRSDWHRILLDLGLAERDSVDIPLEPATYELIELLRDMGL